VRINQLQTSADRRREEVHPRPAVVLADQHQLEQVFLNLLLNAEQAITGRQARRAHHLTRA